MAGSRTVAEEHSGFLGRWARRKTDVLQGKPVAEPAVNKPVVLMVLPTPVADQVKVGCGLIGWLN